MTTILNLLFAAGVVILVLIVIGIPAAFIAVRRQDCRDREHEEARDAKAKPLLQSQFPRYVPTDDDLRDPTPHSPAP